jgi:hypothetical protein
MIPIRYLCQNDVSYCILSSRFFLVFKSNFVLNFYLPMVMFPQLMHLNTVGFGVTRRLSETCSMCGKFYITHFGMTKWTWMVKFQRIPILAQEVKFVVTVYIQGYLFSGGCWAVYSIVLIGWVPLTSRSQFRSASARWNIYLSSLSSLGSCFLERLVASMKIASRRTSIMCLQH